MPQILDQTDEVFFERTLNILKQNSDACYDWIKEMPCLYCPHKPEGSMAVMVSSINS